MKNILLLSDTHSYMDDRILHYASEVDEIWHAGDFGNLEVVEALEKIKVLRGVWGNVDGQEVRILFSEFLEFTCEGVKILMVHIGGYPGKYSAVVKERIKKFKPGLFISGHSHILKVMFDKNNDLLHINPGACGKIGWHKTRTMIRFAIEDSEIKNLEVIELGAK